MEHSSDRLLIKGVLLGASLIAILFSAIVLSCNWIHSQTFWSGIRVGVWSAYTWFKSIPILGGDSSTNMGLNSKNQNGPIIAKNSNPIVIGAHKTGTYVSPFSTKKEVAM